MNKRPTLSEVDPEISQIIQRETERQEYGLEMIPSENFVSEAILEAMGSVLTNKYAEGLPGKRYYGGCEFVDQVETLCMERACKLFGTDFANVQPLSGAVANEAAYEATMQPGDTLMGLRLDHGGHLTHGSPVNFSGKRYKVVAYGVKQSDQLIDYDEARTLAKQHRPKVIMTGATAYSRVIDWSTFRSIADEVGAVMIADIAHYSGLVAAGVYPSPVPYSDLVTSTTHKSIRGPRSGMILGREAFRKAVNKAVFPGLQGGPHMHTIAAKAVMLKEAGTPEFKEYATRVIANARTLSEELLKNGLDVVTGGTDSHLLLIDVRPLKLTGKIAEHALDQVGITSNKNTVPFDPEPPTICSGVRLGTPALTTRGMMPEHMVTVASLIVKALMSHNAPSELTKVKAEVQDLATQFPLYRHRLT